MNRLENEAQQLGKKRKSLEQQEQAARSSSAKRIIRGKTKKLEREITEKAVEMMRLDAKYQREAYRRKHCKIPSSRCPLAPMRK